MFTIEQIDQLVSAGYDLQEILAVNNPSGDPAPAPAPAPAPEHDNGNGQILDAINNLAKIIQGNNIRMGGFPAPTDANNPETILASIINPPGKTKK